MLARGYLLKFYIEMYIMNLQNLFEAAVHFYTLPNFAEHDAIMI